MAWLGEVLISALILVGALFLLVGSFGLVKLPDLLQRLHAPTKSTTLGIGALLLASIAYFAVARGTPSLHELIIAVFLFLTAPITAHMIAKAHLLRSRGLQRHLPQPPGGEGWATLTRRGAREPPRPAPEPASGREPPRTDA